jgi:predicted house-cleaning NTP pyrophosphatase (Maf/HAM1 superfamily)
MLVHYLPGICPIQEHTEMLLERMEGSFTNVVGLPVDEVAAALRELSAADPAP